MGYWITTKSLIIIYKAINKPTHAHTIFYLWFTLDLITFYNICNKINNKNKYAWIINKDAE